MAANQFKMRNAQVIFHHLFKASLGFFKRNMSWQVGILKMESIEHVHFYHSVNSLGMKQQWTTEVGGHFHEVKYEVVNGLPTAICGPAIKRETRKTPSGDKVKIVPLKWSSVNGEGDTEFITDDHTHEMEYRGTDELTLGNAPSRADLAPAPAPTTFETPVVVEGFSESDAEPRKRK